MTTLLPPSHWRLWRIEWRLHSRSIVAHNIASPLSNVKGSKKDSISMSSQRFRPSATCPARSRGKKRWRVVAGVRRLEEQCREDIREAPFCVTEC